MQRYDFKSIEKKWQDIWEQKKVFAATQDYSKPKYYPLVEFPYPSGAGLHVGHPRSYTALDTVARKRRLEGYNVLYPMGWDAFGLPTENYAIKHHVHPETVTRDNVARFESQLRSIGLSFDWSRTVNTTDPGYYKWTQWIFLKLFEKGLAYKKEMAVNWCTSCKVVLANEEVVDGGCERCGGAVERRVKSQWMLGITQYAQRLLDDLALVDYPERVRLSQQNWIGRSTGCEADVKASTGDIIKLYTTRPDTMFGATYMVLSPEHPILDNWAQSGIIKNIDKLSAYQKEAARKSELERAELNKDKTGVRLEGVHCYNPANDKEIPVFVSDYVLISYGTGAIMGVPAHDARDWEFAKKFGMPIVEVISGGEDVNEKPYTEKDGRLVNSDFLNGLDVLQAIERMSDWLEQSGKGVRKVNYKLRDWVFSRQRYWGEPIPIVHCEKCGFVPLPEDELPLKLPEVESYEPTETGDSPLAAMENWVNTTCSVCGSPAKRETDTMPQWAGSSWYFLRYCDPNNDNAIASRQALDYWMPVDWYNGGMEHTTLHLLYSRFWHKFLYDIGVVSCNEPYKKRTSHGVILGENSEKMSKSRGNVVNPDDIINEYGADTLRLYELFIGDFEKAAPWSQASIRGCKRFLDRTWALVDIMSDSGGFSAQSESIMHKTIKKVSEDIETLKYNTAIAAMMTLINHFYQAGGLTRDEMRTFLILLNPFAPHITEELYEQCGFGGMLCSARWPEYDPDKCVDAQIEIAIQVNGKVKGHMMIAADDSSESVLAAVRLEDAFRFAVAGKSVVKEIYVPGKLVNIVVK